MKPNTCMQFKYEYFTIVLFLHFTYTELTVNFLKVQEISLKYSTLQYIF